VLKEIPLDRIPEIVRLYGDFTENDKVRIFPNERFGYLREAPARADPRRPPPRRRPAAVGTFR